MKPIDLRCATAHELAMTTASSESALGRLADRGAVLSGGVALGSLLHALKLYDEMRHTGGPPVQANVLSALDVQPLRGSRYTDATIEYRSHQGEDVKCQVSVKLYGTNYRALKEGDTISVIPRNVSCYQPVLPSDLVGYGPDMIAFMIGSALCALCISPTYRRFRELWVKRQQPSLR